MRMHRLARLRIRTTIRSNLRDSIIHAASSHAQGPLHWQPRAIGTGVLLTAPPVSVSMTLVSRPTIKANPPKEGDAKLLGLRRTIVRYDCQAAERDKSVYRVFGGVDRFFVRCTGCLAEPRFDRQGRRV